MREIQNTHFSSFSLFFIRLGGINYPLKMHYIFIKNFKSLMLCFFWKLAISKKSQTKDCLIFNLKFSLSYNTAFLTTFLINVISDTRSVSHRTILKKKNCFLIKKRVTLLIREKNSIQIKIIENINFFILYSIQL